MNIYSTYEGLLTEPKTPRNKSFKLSLDMNSIDNPPTPTSRHFYTNSVRDSFRNTIGSGNVSTNFNSIDFKADQKPISNLSYNIKRRISNIMEEINPKPNNNADNLYLLTDGEVDTRSKKQNNILSDFEALKNGFGSRNNLHSKKGLEEKAEKNKLKRELTYFSVTNKYTETELKSLPRNFNKPIVNLDKPHLKLNMDDFSMNSPTSVRKGYMVTSTVLRDHLSGKNTNSVKKNIFGEHFGSGPISNGVGKNSEKNSFSLFEMPSYKKTRKSLFQ